MTDIYKVVTLKERPKGGILLGQTFDVSSSPKPKETDLEDGQVLAEVLYLSVDPAMRTWLDDTRGYLTPVQIGEVMRGGGICRVIASKSSMFKAGDLTQGLCGWREYAILHEKDLQKIHLPPESRITDSLGLLGLTGLTAYFGLLEIGNPKPGELVVVSGAAGATGSVACQIAKLKGARVVGIAGSKDKIQWLQELGCDVALDYKSPDFVKQFHEATKDYIDVYFDNVGGEILDLAIGQAKKGARFVECGQISQYNVEKVTPLTNILKVTTLSIKMQGFIVLDFKSRWPEAQKELASWLGEGKLQRKESIFHGGLGAAPEALKAVFDGLNTGKAIVEVMKP